MHPRIWSWVYAAALTIPLLALIALRATEPPGTAVPLVFNHRTIAVFRAPLNGLTPGERAEIALRRVQRLTATYNEEPIVPRVLPGGITLQVHGKILFAIVPDDVDTLANQTLRSIADQAVRQLSQKQPAGPGERLRDWVASLPRWIWLGPALVAASLALRWLAARLLKVACPHCQNADRALLEVGHRFSKKSWFKLKRTHHCRACGHQWGAAKHHRARDGGTNTAPFAPDAPEPDPPE